MEELLARPLHTPKLVRDFLENALQIKHDHLPSIVAKIVTGELGVDLERKYRTTLNTYDSEDYRDADYASDYNRWELRKRIVEELITMERLDSDEDIRLGIGGAFPRKEIKAFKDLFASSGVISTDCAMHEEPSCLERGSNPAQLYKMGNPDVILKLK